MKAEATALNASTASPKNMGYDSRFQSYILQLVPVIYRTPGSSHIPYSRFQSYIVQPVSVIYRTAGSSHVSYSRFQSYIVRGKSYYCICGVLQGAITKGQEFMFRDCLNGQIHLSCLVIATFLFAILYIMKNRASFLLSSKL